MPHRQKCSKGHSGKKSAKMNLKKGRNKRGKRPKRAPGRHVNKFARQTDKSAMA